MAFYIKQNDTLPNLPFQIFRPDGSPADLTGAVVEMAVRAIGSKEPKFKKPCVMTDPAQGIGYYDWAFGDTEDVGKYQYEFEITWANGQIQTVPADGYFDLVIVDDIG